MPSQSWKIQKYSRLYADGTPANTWISSSSKCRATLTTTLHLTNLIIQNESKTPLETINLSSETIQSIQLCALVKDLTLGLRYTHNTFQRRFQIKFDKKEECYDMVLKLNEYIRVVDMNDETKMSKIETVKSDLIEPNQNGYQSGLIQYPNPLSIKNLPLFNESIVKCDESIDLLNGINIKETVDKCVQTEMKSWDDMNDDEIVSFMNSVIQSRDFKVIETKIKPFIHEILDP